MFGKLRSLFSKFKREVQPQKKGLLKKISEARVEKLLEGLEEQLLENNVAYDVAEKICSELRKVLLEKKSRDVKKELARILEELLSQPAPDLLKLCGEHKPLVILFVGVNGVGKTTTIAKLANWFLKHGKSVVLAASDTFRAAAIEQLESHAQKLGIRLIKHKYGADPAAVAFDARKHAEAKGIDVVLIDTAGRQHASEDLMAELQKIKRVVKPHLTILSVDALTGNDASEQARYFSEKIGIDGIIIAKVDADDRGGAVISASWVSKKPVLFLGTGQNYEDLERFEAEKVVRRVVD